MTLKAQIILIAILLIALFLVLNSVRKHKLQLKYALPWFACIIVLVVFVAIPDLIQVLANLLGIQSPVNMVFFLGFVFSLAIVFVLTMTISRLTAQVRELTQAIALMEKRQAEDGRKF